MQSDIQRQILGAFLVALRPIARILLRFGIGFQEFSEISKTAFVDVATNDYGLRGRPTNISRVAVMTGLTRKEVRRIRRKIEDGNQLVFLKTAPMSDIVHRWHGEDEYLDSSGRPLILPFAGDNATFSSLVRKYGGDIPPGAMRTELKRVGAVEEDKQGNLKVLSRSIHPKLHHDKLITAVLHGLYPMITTIAYNVNPDRQDEAWIQKSVYTQSIRNSDIPRLRRISFDRLNGIVETIDDLFMAYETLHDQNESQNDENTVVIGVFYFEENSSEPFYSYQAGNT